MTQSLDPTRIRDDAAWELFQVTPEFRRYRLELEPGKWIVRTDYIANDDLLASNQDDFNASHGRRWGDGQVAARIPLNVFYQQIAPRLKDGDRDFTRWFLNHESGRPYRTFKGRI